MPTGKGSVRLFKLFGITVYVHWMLWFILGLWYTFNIATRSIFITILGSFRIFVTIRHCIDQ